MFVYVCILIKLTCLQPTIRPVEASMIIPSETRPPYLVVTWTPLYAPLCTSSIDLIDLDCILSHVPIIVDKISMV